MQVNYIVQKKNAPLPLRNAATAFKNGENAFKNALQKPSTRRGGKAAERSEGILEAFCKDSSKAAEEVLRLLEDPTPEKAAEVAARLPGLIPEDPALAAVIAEARAEEFGGVKPKDGGEVSDAETQGRGDGLTQEDAERLWDEIMGDEA